jgi:tRNA(Ile)-lysidine synthase
MASTRKRPSAEAGLVGAVRAFLGAQALSGKRVAVGLSGGVDSVVLLHVMRALAPEFGLRISAIHVHHGLSPNADAWSRFCRVLCRRWKVRLAVRRVRVTRAGRGLEAAAREARYGCYRNLRADAIALGHQLDDQAETVLMNLLRGAGLAGASGMRASASIGEKLLLRPLLEVPREAIVHYAKLRRLEWIEDESNRDVALTRNFLRHRVAPLLAARYPRWRESLARAARHFASADADANRLLRNFLSQQGLRSPSERKLADMLRQLSTVKRDARVRIAHDGAELRVYRGRVVVKRAEVEEQFTPVRWSGERRLALPQLGGDLLFRRMRGEGIDLPMIGTKEVTIRLRSGGERLQPNARRPRRTLKNLFQEAGVPPWERERLPLLFCGPDLIWAPGLGVDVRYRASAGSRGIVPDWRPIVPPCDDD